MGTKMNWDNNGAWWKRIKKFSNVYLLLGKCIKKNKLDSKMF